MGKAVLGFFGILVLGALVIGGCMYSGYNRAITLDEQVKNAWAQVDNQLQRRFDLVQNLVNTVKGYAQHEQDVFLGIAKSREAYTQAKQTGNVAEQAKAANSFESALGRLLVIQERYPDLKANEGFLKLQDTLEGTENRLAVERQRYNEAVRTLNVFTRQLLGRIYAGFAGVKQAEYFEVPSTAKVNPTVDFSKKP